MLEHCYRYISEVKWIQTMESDSCLYMKSVKDPNGVIKFVILSIYVNDILLFSNDTSMLNEEVQD